MIQPFRGILRLAYNTKFLCLIMVINKYVFLAICLTCFTTGFGQISDHGSALQHQNISFIQNLGQWNSAVVYRAPLGTGSVYLENNGFTYVQMDANDIDVAHHHSGEEVVNQKNDFPIDGHAWRTSFVGANDNPTLKGQGKRTEYHNYFLGNDPSKWASHVPLYNEVKYENLYPSIDLKVYSANQHFKYDFIIAPKGNPDQIKLKYDGLNQLEIRDGNLIAITTVGEFIENAPYAYQLIDGVEVPVTCLYTLENLTVGFEFPGGYDKSLPLIIDPVLVGATLSGGTVTNFGHCATYDSDENIYTGARCFGPGYPTDLGSFQTTFSAAVDIAISKLSPDASTLIYATYLGGSSTDLPHSMVTNKDNELYVFGSTLSIDYPVSAGAYDMTGPAGGLTEDIIVTHLSLDGSAVVGSTFVGGAGQDGINGLTSNYGDNYRGEIVVDNDGNCFIASCTSSADFPVTPGVHQGTYGGGSQDAVIFSMPPDLSSLRWSTFVGGMTGESALGLRLDANDDVYVSGVATGEFMVMSGYQTTYQGGDRDAFVIRLINDGTVLSESSYWGTTTRDAAFFVDLDNAGNVFLYGQSNGGLSEVTPGVYSNPGSHQFICKLSPDLTTLEFGTVVGAGGANFVPIAFMVDACGYVYFSGHSATGALPLTGDALYMTGGFYLGVLQPEAVALEFATLYSGDHVDGGTSRFDPEHGIVYQAVCSCEPFTTTPGAFGTIPGGFCDIGVFKIDFGIAHVNANAEATPDSEGCSPFTVDFDNSSTGLTYEWDFDDGSPFSTEFAPSHTFTVPGTYQVRLVAFDPEGCLTSDTTYIEIVVSSGVIPTASFDYDVNCATGEVTVNYTGTPDVPVIFTMGDGTTITETDFTHTYLTDGTFTITLTVGDGICSDFGVETQNVSIGAPAIDLIFNNPTCYLFSDGSVTIDVLEPTGDEVIIITDGDGIVLNVGGSNTANTLSSGWYYYSVDLGNGCALTDSVLLVDPPAINAQIVIKTPLCYGQETGRVIVDTVYNWQGAYDEIVYIWAPDPNGISGQFADTLDNVGSGNYTLTINDENGCSNVFDFTITEPEPLLFAEFGYDPAYCRMFDYQSGNGVVFGAAVGGTPDYTYQWTNLQTGESVINTTWGGLNPGTYELAVTDENGCTLTQALVVDSLNPIANFTVTTDQLKTDCEALVPVDITFTNNSLNYSNPNDPFADTTFFWNFDHDNIPWQVSHDIDEEFIINYAQSGTYEVCLVAINKNGCTDTTCKTLILCDPTVFVPVNIFTPNADGKNDIFTFVYKSIAIKEFYCVVVDRRGVTNAEFNDITQGWDGTDKKGNYVPDGVYFYKYVGKEDTGAEIVGQGTVQVIKG